MHQNQLRGEQFQRPFDDQPVVDDRAGHPALTDAVTLDNPVRRGEVDDPALLVGEAFQLRPEQPHHIVARIDEIAPGTPGSDSPPSEFRRG